MAPSNTTRVAGSEKENSVIACVVMSSFVLDQMAEMSLGSSPLYDQPSCGTYQYDRRGSSCELQNRYWTLGMAQKRKKGKDGLVFALST